MSRHPEVRRVHQDQLPVNHIVWQFRNHTSSVLGVVPYDAHGPPVHPAEASDDVLSVEGHQLKEFALVHHSYIKRIIV